MASQPCIRSQAAGKELDDPETTAQRRMILQSKHFLKKIYEEWYSFAINSLPERSGPVLELGSGAGFLGDLCSEVISSEIFFSPQIDVVTDGSRLPFKNESLRAIVLIDVLHHISNPPMFFEEASRCVKSGGRVIMVEPWASSFSSFVYRYFHHEPFDPGAENWEFASSGPLSGANGALPWMIFARDRQIFLSRFPAWEIKVVRPFMSFRYLLSGGFSLPCLMPVATFAFWKKVEQMIERLTKKTPMFAQIIIEKR